MFFTFMGEFSVREQGVSYRHKFTFKRLKMCSLLFGSNSQKVLFLFNINSEKSLLLFGSNTVKVLV